MSDNYYNLLLSSICGRTLRLFSANVLILFSAITFSAHIVHAQTATVTASNGQSCAGTRFGSDLKCTSNDFTTTLTFTQPSATALSSCRAGDTISIDIIGDVASGAADRYDAGFFIGELANDPRINDITKTCSNTVFPTSPIPFLDADTDACGDYQSSSTSTLLVEGVKLTCSPAPGTNELAVPYTMVFSNQLGGSTCTAANITANTTAKCISSTAATVTGVEVNGFLTITKQTNPGGDPESFTFTGASAGTVSPSNFSLSDGQTNTFEVVLDPAGGTRTLTVTESAVAGWNSTATITCTDPSGGSSAAFVTVNNAARTITATLDATNYGAVCTVTNDKIVDADLVTIKTLQSADATPAEGDSVSFLITVTNNGSAQATNVSLTDSLPAGITATGNAVSQGAYVSGTGIWSVGTLANGASATLTLTGTVDIGQGGNTITNITTAASGDQPDPTTTGDDLTEAIVVDNGADLVTVKTLQSADATPAEGDSVTFLITVTNNGSAQATNVNLTDSLPAGITATGNAVSQGAYVSGTGIWSVGTLANGASATLTLTGTVDIGQGGNTITNITTAATGDQPDPTTTGDDLTEAVVVDNGADLVTVKTLQSADATPAEGDSVTFLITVTNNGSAQATNVSLTDSLPAGITATGNAVSQGAYVSGTGIWSVGTLANGASATLTLTGTVDIGQGGNTITNITTAASGDQPDPTTTGDDLTEAIVVETNLPAALSGYVWLDSDHNKVRNEITNGRGGWSVELCQGDIKGGFIILATATTATDGSYSFTGIPPGSNYGVIFKRAQSGNVYGYLDGLTLQPNTTTSEQNQPIDPSGIVYDALTRQPVAGAVVTFSGPVGFNPVTDLVGGAANVSITTNATGEYQFFLQPTAPAGTYSLTVTSPAGYIPGPSTAIPACTATLNVGAAPNPLLVQTNNAPPVTIAPLHNPNICAANSAGVAAGAGTTQYYFSFNLSAVSGNVLNNHIPIEAVPSPGTLIMSKSTSKTQISRGELVPYTITVRNTGLFQNAVTIVDQIPPGFKYRRGSSSIDGVRIEPDINGRTLSWSGLSVANGQTRTLKLILVVGSGVGEAKYVNQAWAANGLTGAIVSNIATATVRVIPDPTFDCSDIIGKVFNDKNRNGYQDRGERGIANVRLATVRGLLITTDRYGRFHIACADVPDEDRGSNFILKLDTRTLPTGYRITTENPRVVRLTRGKMAKINFGAAAQRTVRIDVMGRAFNRNGTALRPKWTRGIDKVISALAREESVLRISYRRTNRESRVLAKRRMKALVNYIQSKWRNTGSTYRLLIETDYHGG